MWRLLAEGARAGSVCLILPMSKSVCRALAFPAGFAGGVRGGSLLDLTLPEYESGNGSVCRAFPVGVRGGSTYFILPESESEYGSVRRGFVESWCRGGRGIAVVFSFSISALAASSSR